MKYADIKDFKAEISGSKLIGYNEGNFIDVPASKFPGVESIADDAFWEKKKYGLLGETVKSIDSLALPSGVVTIPNNAFKNCKHLRTIILPDTVRHIGDNAFSGCEKLESVKVSVDLVSQDRSAFSQSITFGFNVFAGCNRLNTFDLTITDDDIQNLEDKKNAVTKIFGLRNTYFSNDETLFQLPGLKLEKSKPILQRFLSTFNFFIVKYLDCLDDGYRQIIQVIPQDEYNKLNKFVFSNILLLPSGETSPEKFVTGTPSPDSKLEMKSLADGIWAKHPCGDFYYNCQKIGLGKTLDEYFFEEKYSEFIHYANSLGAKYEKIEFEEVKADNAGFKNHTNGNASADVSVPQVVDVNAHAKTDVQSTNESISKIVNKWNREFFSDSDQTFEYENGIWFKIHWNGLTQALKNKKGQTWNDYDNYVTYFSNSSSVSATIESELKLNMPKANADISFNFLHTSEVWEKFWRTHTLKLIVSQKKREGLGDLLDGEKKSEKKSDSKSENPESPETTEKKSPDGREKSEVKEVDFHYTAPSHKFFGREKLKTEIHEKFNELNVINIHGIGGIGKTSFAHLYIEKYYAQEKYYNKVCHIYSNENVVTDFVGRVNDYLDIDLSNIRDYRIQLQTILDKLDTIEGKNLLVLDINITDINVLMLFPQYIDEFVTRLKNWHVLLLSRTSIVAESTERIYLEDFGAIEEDREAISEIFKYNLRGYPCFYSDDELQKLFEKLMYHPLLVEHLAAFVSRNPMKSFEEIYSIINDFSDNEVTDRKYSGTGISEIGKAKKYQKVLHFLEKIITYDQFEAHEQIVLRHFILWPYDYIPYGVIQDLLNGYGIKYLNNTLEDLVDKTVLQKEEKEVSFRLHGSLAEVLKKQVFDGMRELDYSQYFDNIINYEVINTIRTEDANDMMKRMKNHQSNENCIRATLDNDDFMKEYYWEKLNSIQVTDRELEGKYNMVKVEGANFYICKYTVTQGDWEKIYGKDSNRSEFKKGDDYPVDSVSWYGAMLYIMKLNRETGWVFRLPTEAEWEYAARGGSRSQGYTYSGSNTIELVGWYIENAGKTTQQVGLLNSNELGIYDMSGNVREWCFDWYDGLPSNRVLRGGSWQFGFDQCSVSFRSFNIPNSTSNNNGFRLALSISSENKSVF